MPSIVIKIIISDNYFYNCRDLTEYGLNILSK